MKLAVVLLLAGCDRVFGLHAVPAPLVDGSHRTDATLFEDAPACVMGAGRHDEDGDGMPDDCDLCPTIPSTNADMDGDGVGDECDPRPGQPDQIEGFLTFTSKDGITTKYGTVTQAGDSVTVKSSTFDTTHTYTPGTIAVVVQSLKVTPAIFALELGPSQGLACDISPVCTNNQATLCMTTFSNGTQIGSEIGLVLADGPTTTVQIYRDLTGAHCGVDDIAVNHSPAASNAPQSGVVEVVGADTTAVVVDSLIGYRSPP